MTRFTADQLAFAKTKQSYMGRDESIEFLRTMDIKMSVGHWSAGDFCDRFAPPGYHSDDPGFKNDFASQCRRTRAAGINAIEIHQHLFEKSLNGDLDWPAIERAVSCITRHGDGDGYRDCDGDRGLHGNRNGRADRDSPACSCNDHSKFVVLARSPVGARCL